MVALAVVVARLTMTAPFWAPLLVEVVRVGVATCCGGVVVNSLPFPPPQPHNKAPDRKITVSIHPPARILNVSRSQRLDLRLRRRKYESTAAWVRQTRGPGYFISLQ